MTATPFLVRPTPPMPEREATLNFPGGSLTAARGTIAAAFKNAAFVSTCAFVEVERTRKQYMRTDEIGADPRSVEASSWTAKVYPSQTKSIAAGGEPIQLKIQGEWWTARLSGTHTAFMEFLCDSADSLYDYVAFRSARGTLYGPVANPLYTPEG